MKITGTRSQIWFELDSGELYTGKGEMGKNCFYVDKKTLRDRAGNLCSKEEVDSIIGLVIANTHLGTIKIYFEDD